MKKQNYRNHVRYYAPHHFILYPILFALFIYSLYSIYEYPERSVEWKVIAAGIALTGWLSYMTRQHYSLILQNRIVRLEMRVRYFQLTGLRLEQYEPKLTFKQLAALRFASDEELPGLLQRAIDEKLSASHIKKSIKNWVPDDMRV